mgnify:FL=1
MSGAPTNLWAMCASYGLDPRFSDPDALFEDDAELLDELRGWAARNAGETLLPTGKNLRNLNPIVRESGGERQLDLGWWGYLVDGAPSRFPSINTRSERLSERRGALPSTAVVPATSWFEMQKPSRQWFSFGAGDTEPQLFALAAVTQPGRTADGDAFTCYSVIMRPAPERLAHVHDRTPLLIPAAFMGDWLAGEAPPSELIAAAIAESDRALGDVAVTEIAKRP